MKMTLWQKTSIISKGLLSLGVAFSIYAPIALLENKDIIKTATIDKFMERQIKKKAVAFIFQKIWFYGMLGCGLIDDLFAYHGSSFQDELKDLASANDLEIFPSTQRQLFQLQISRVNAALIKNPNLIPELLPQLFMEHSAELTPLIQNDNFKYHNPQTQALLEKYLLLI